MNAVVKDINLHFIVIGQMDNTHMLFGSEECQKSKRKQDEGVKNGKVGAILEGLVQFEKLTLEHRPE